MSVFILVLSMLVGQISAAPPASCFIEEPLREKYREVHLSKNYLKSTQHRIQEIKTIITQIDIWERQELIDKYYAKALRKKMFAEARTWILPDGSQKDITIAHLDSYINKHDVSKHYFSFVSLISTLSIALVVIAIGLIVTSFCRDQGIIVLWEVFVYTMIVFLTAAAPQPTRSICAYLLIIMFFISRWFHSADMIETPIKYGTICLLCSSSFWWFFAVYHQDIVLAYFATIGWLFLIAGSELTNFFMNAMNFSQDKRLPRIGIIGLAFTLISIFLSGIPLDNHGEQFLMVFSIFLVPVYVIGVIALYSVMLICSSMFYCTEFNNDTGFRENNYIELQVISFVILVFTCPFIYSLPDRGLPGFATIVSAFVLLKWMEIPWRKLKYGVLIGMLTFGGLLYLIAFLAYTLPSWFLL